MNNKKIILFAATIFSATLIVGSAIGSALAYFTSYVTAKGVVPIRLGSVTSIEEPSVVDWTKHVVVHNNEGVECWVRVKAFSGSTYKLIYSDKSGSWIPGNDGYYYYNKIVPAKTTTEELHIKIDNVPSDAKPGDNFNVVVIYESTPVLYDEEGKEYADWTKSIVVNESSKS